MSNADFNEAEHQRELAERDAEIERLRMNAKRWRVALVEARRWIGDGDLGDGMHRSIWTPRYAAAVDLIDAALSPLDCDPMPRGHQDINDDDGTGPNVGGNAQTPGR